MIGATYALHRFDALKSTAALDMSVCTTTRAGRSRSVSPPSHRVTIDQAMSVHFIGSPTRVDEDGSEVHYAQIKLGNTTYSVGDFVHLASEDKLPYIGRIILLYQQDGHSLARIQWLFRPRDTHLKGKGRSKHEFGKNEVFFSSDEDVNDVRSILEQVYVFPEGYKISPEAVGGAKCYHCCLEYIPAKKIFRPLLDVSALSDLPKEAHLFKKKKLKESKAAFLSAMKEVSNTCPFCNKVFSRPQACGMHKRSCGKKSKPQWTENNDNSTNKKENSGSSDDTSSEDETDSSSDESGDEEPTIRIGPEYQAEVPCLEASSSNKRRTPRKVYKDDPILLYSAEEQKTSMPVDPLPEIGDRIEVTLENENKIHFPAIITMVNDDGTIDVVLQDGTVRKHLPKSKVSPVNHTPMHLLHGLTIKELDERGNLVVPQLWSSADHVKFRKLLTLFGTKFDTIAGKFPGRSRKDIYSFYTYIRLRSNIDELHPKKPSRFSECGLCKRKSTSSNMTSCTDCCTLFCSSCQQLTGGQYKLDNPKREWMCNLCAENTGKRRKSLRTREKNKTLLTSPRAESLNSRAVMNLVRPDGSWACAQCTFINAASHSKCRVCTSKAPHAHISSPRRKRKPSKEAPEEGDGKRQKVELVSTPVISANQLVVSDAITAIVTLRNLLFLAKHGGDYEARKQKFGLLLEKLQEFSSWGKWPQGIVNLKTQVMRTRFASLDRFFAWMKTTFSGNTEMVENAHSRILRLLPEDVEKLYRSLRRPL